jgi:hypothetical protein
MTTRQNRQRYSDDDAFDESGILKDGRTTRVSLQMRDAIRRKARESDMLRDVNSRPRITTRIVDGNGNDGLALQKPGYRISTDDAGKNRVSDAHREYQTRLVHAYKIGDGVQCSTCFGSGEINGEDCDDCDGTGVMPERSSSSKGYGSGNEGSSSDDSRSVNLDQHRQTMDRLYAARDAELQDAWRNNG